MKTYIKYKNRKYYSPKDGYVSCETFISHVQKGEEFRVMCHITKTDVTDATLASCVAALKMNRETMMGLIRGAKCLTNY